MSEAIHAFAVTEAKQPLSAFDYTPIALGDAQVEVAIAACGVCHSDLHQAHNDWGIAKYPLVPGHEIVGRVTAVGAAVTDVAVGDRVGIGPQTGSCNACRECDRGEDELCLKKVKSYNSPTGDALQPYTYGGFADRIRVNAAWAFKIPDGLADVDAAPLLCAGITTWTPFVHNKIGKEAAGSGDEDVGIIGMGGLGHMAVQFAANLGVKSVTVLSTSANKEAEAKRFGATDFLVTKDADAMKARAKTFDFILSTVSAEVDWNMYLHLLKPDGKLVMVGLPNVVSFKPGLLVANRLTIAGSYLASSAEIRKMLDFCAAKGITAVTESLPMNADNVNKALQMVEANTPRYRVVLTNQ